MHLSINILFLAVLLFSQTLARDEESHSSSSESESTETDASSSSSSAKTSGESDESSSSSSSSSSEDDYQSIFHHHNHEEMIKMMTQIHEMCPDITRLYNLTEPSVQNRSLTVLEITENPGVHKPGKPEFKYIGNMHGNEVTGKEMLLYLMLAMCEEYINGNDLVHFIVKETRVHILPTMNPDGWEAASEYRKEHGKSDWLTGRANANNVDLNRNFPDLNAKMYENEKEHSGRNNHLVKVEKAIANDESLQPETRAVMRWLTSIGFVLSANLHGGDLVANYPYDETRSGKAQEYTACPDDHTFVFLAKSYALAHRTMADPERVPCDKDGDNKPITNGGLWYSVAKGMQDYNYLNTNSFEITLELGCDKFPPEADLEQYWVDNVGALFNYMLQAHSGVKGFVTSKTGEPIENAEIKVTNLATGLPIEHDILSLEGGDYYRLLGDGFYYIRADAPGFHQKGHCIRIKNNLRIGESKGELHTAPVLNFVLTPDSEDREPTSQEDEENCQGLVNEIQEQTQIDDRDLLVSVLSYLDPGYKWSFYAHSMTTLELYYYLVEALQKLEPSDMRAVLHMLPRAVQEQLELVILADANKSSDSN